MIRKNKRNLILIIFVIVTTLSAIGAYFTSYAMKNNIFTIGEICHDWQYLSKQEHLCSKCNAKETHKWEAKGDNLVCLECQAKKSLTLVDGETFKSKIPGPATSVVFTDEKAPDGATLTNLADDGRNGVVGWRDGDIYKVSTQIKGKNIYANPSCCQMFDENSNLYSIDFDKLDTGQVTDMSNMFSGCYNLTSLDLSGFDTSKVTSMYAMFNSCSNLTSLDVSSFDTSQVTSMEEMFCFCYRLTNLDLSGFDTSRVMNMGCMFEDCNRLTSLDVSGFDTSKVTSMKSMFRGCKKLQKVKLGSKFKWVGTDGYLPAPFPAQSSDTGVDGKWYSEKTGIGYAPNEIPSNFADTYYAYKFNRITLKKNNGQPDEVVIANKVSELPKPQKDGHSFTGWSQEGLTFSNPNNNYSWTKGDDGVWASGNKAVQSSESVMRSSTFTINENEGQLSFDWKSVGEYQCDYLGYDIYDVGAKRWLSGVNSPNYESCLESLKLANADIYTTVTKTLPKGTYQIQFMYGKDGSNDYSLDGGFVKDIRINGRDVSDPKILPDSYAFTGDLTLSANYSKKYNIMLKYNNGQADKVIKAALGSEIPDASKADHAFAGWSKYGITFKNPNSSAFAWSKDKDGIWSSGNKGYTSTTSTMKSTEFKIDDGGGEISFDWRSSGELDHDYLGYDIYDVTNEKWLSGQSSPSYNSCLENLKGKASTEYTTVRKELPAGTYQLQFMYGKDGSSNYYEDKGFVKNIKLDNFELEGEEFINDSYVFTGDTILNANYDKLYNVTK